MRQIGRATTALALRWPVASVFVIVTVIAGFGLVAYSTTDYSHVTEASLGIRPTMAPEPPEATPAPASALAHTPVTDFVLTDGSRFKRGSTPRDIYLTFFTGLMGTPMPSYAGALKMPDEEWDLVHYVYKLSQGAGVP